MVSPTGNNVLTLIVTYYNQPEMLAQQYRAWASYGDLPVQFIVIDDGSQLPAVEVARPPLPISIYRVDFDIPWHQDGARNLGAHVAPDGWLLLLDIDHVLPASAAGVLVNSLPGLVKGVAYRPARRLATSGKPLPVAANIWLMDKADYWQVGGYDERLCGHYGTDQEYRPRLAQTLREQALPVTLDVYLGADVPDAATQGLNRAVVKPARLDGPPVVLSFPWEKVA